MSLTMWFYWIDVLQKVGILFIVSGAALIFLSGFIALFANEVFEIPELKAKKLMVLSWICGFLLITLSMFIPSKETMHAMLAAEAANEIVKHPEVQKIGGRALDILNKKLDEMEGEKK
jgi:hypothetical protein